MTKFTVPASFLDGCMDKLQTRVGLVPGNCDGSPIQIVSLQQTSWQGGSDTLPTGVFMVSHTHTKTIPALVNMAFNQLSPENVCFILK